MRILLTGHKGFIGSNMLKALAGHDVKTYDWGEDPTLLTTHDRDVCIHIGGISSTTERDVDKIMRQNYDFSCQLLDRCMNTGTHFQYSSSAERYAIKLQESAYHVGDRIQGFRYFNVYGSGEAHKGGQASPYHQFEKQAQETGRIRVFEGSRDYRRDFVPVSQVIDTHLAFLNVKQSGVFNVGTGRTQSFYEVAEQFGVPIEEIPMPEHLKPSYQTYTCADMTKTDRALAS